MTWLILLLVLTALAFLPLGISAAYDAAGATVHIIAGPVRIGVYPGKKKKKDSSAEAKTQHAGSVASGGSKQGGSVSDFLPIVRAVLAFLKDFHKRLRVNYLMLNVSLAGDDPCDLAQNYGIACASLGALWPQLHRLFVIQKHDVRVWCNFEAEQTTVKARLDITIALGMLLVLVLHHGIGILRAFITLKNNRKGGATI